MTDLSRPALRALARAGAAIVVLACAAGGAAAQQNRQATPPSPPAWTPAQSPIQPVCIGDDGAAGGRNSPVVKFETRDNKVFLVVQSRPNETVAVVTHETGAISFDRPVCIMGVDAIVTQPAGTAVPGAQAAR